MSKKKEMSLSEAMQKALNSCSKPYYKHIKRIERENRPKKDYSIYRTYKKTKQDWLFEVFPEAYRIASDDGSFIPMMRQLYYVSRRLLQKKGCKWQLTDSYHRSNFELYEQVKGRRLCDRKAVGSLLEPHSACPLCGAETGCNLGTKGVKNYVVPHYRYNKILYVEKAGFMQQLIAANIHNRYDIAIAAGAGFAVHAAKELFAKIEKNIPVKIYCLHDADISGVMIAHTLKKKLLFENYHIKAIDFGLKPWEAIKLNLPSEKVFITSEPPAEIKKMVTQKELDWLLGEDYSYIGSWKKKRKILYKGNRVELNAFTPKEFLAWVDKKLRKAFEIKVIPEQDIIQNYIEETFEELIKNKVTEDFLESTNLSEIIEEVRSKIELKDITRIFIIKGFAHNGFSSSWKDIVRGEMKERIEEIEM